MSHEGHASNKKDALQTKKRTLQLKKTGALQTKEEAAENKKSKTA